MTSPTTFNTPSRAIAMGMVDAGLIAQGDEPTSEQYAEGMNRLNDLINFWQTQGLKLWLQFDLPVPLVAGQAIYTIGPGGSVNMAKPMRVIDNGYYLDTNNNRRPIFMISRDEYTRLSNIVNQGPINSYFVDKQATSLIVNFWLTPDATAATGVAHLAIQQQVTNVVSLIDSMNFPQEWFLWIRWMFADDVATGQPQAIMDRCSARATAYREALEAWDVEDASTSFQPDQRNMYAGNRFR